MARISTCAQGGVPVYWHAFLKGKCDLRLWDETGFSQHGSLKIARILGSVRRSVVGRHHGMSRVTS
jgi:hypothetical protein